MRKNFQCPPDLLRDKLRLIDENHVAAVDGKTSLSLDSVAARFRRGGTIQLTVQRDGAPRSIVLHARPLPPV